MRKNESPRAKAHGLFFTSKKRTSSSGTPSTKGFQKHTQERGHIAVNKLEALLVALLFATIALGVYINIQEQLSVDRSKLPEKIEENNGFQRWITNLKNKGLDHVEADEFRLQEENEIYNTKWMKVYSFDEEGREEEFEENIAAHTDMDMVVFSPSERLFVDYRHQERNGYKPNEVHFYGVRDDKIIDARVVDCSADANCYFDRAYFLSNDVFVVSEFSRNVDKKAKDLPVCTRTDECDYSIKIHIIDLVNNSRLVYESEPFKIRLEDLIPEL